MWALDGVKMKNKTPPRQEQNKKGTNISTNVTTDNPRPYMVVPYVKGLSEGIQNVCRKHGVQVYCKGGNTIKSLLMTPKDKDPITKKSGIICRYKCNRVDCDDEYIGESSRTFGERSREHLKAPPQYMTILPSLVIVPPLTTLALWGGRTRTCSELLKKQYT